MLDYAANIVAHWPGAQLRQLFEDRPRADGASPDEEVIRFLELPELPEDGAAHAVDEFWERASSNLAARKLRLLFVADAIPPELQRSWSSSTRTWFELRSSPSRSGSTSGRGVRRSCHGSSGEPPPPTT